MNSWNDIPLDDLVEYYDSTITSLLNRFAPSRTKTSRIRPSNVWFDDDCKIAKRLFRMNERKYLKTKLPADQKDWIKQLRDYNKLCASKGSLFWKCQIETGSSNPKRMWHAINTVLGRTERPVQSKNTSVDFAKFFKEKMEKVRCNTANAAPPHFQETTGEWLNEFEHVTEEEVEKLIASAPNKQSSLDPLPAMYLKKVICDVACLLAYIFNRSFENGYVPSKFKNAVVTPLLKKAGLDVDDSNF